MNTSQVRWISSPTYYSTNPFIIICNIPLEVTRQSLPAKWAHWLYNMITTLLIKYKWIVMGYNAIITCTYVCASYKTMWFHWTNVGSMECCSLQRYISTYRICLAAVCLVVLKVRLNVTFVFHRNEVAELWHTL